MSSPTITQFPLSTPDRGPGAIATGPDGNLWFTQSATSAVGIAAVGGSITAGPTLYGPALSLALDSGANLWATQELAGYIARIPPGGPAAEFHVGGLPEQIAAGPDGSAWFTDVLAPSAIKQITSSGTVTTHTTGLTPLSFPTAITAGPGGTAWFTEAAGRIGRITPGGTITEYSTGLSALATAITAGPDGNLWFTDAANGAAAIGRITPGGTITEFSSGLIPSSAPVGITAGPDGNLWFTAPGNHGSIGRVTLSSGPAPAPAPAPTPAAPTAVTGAASALTSTSATVSGTVGPGATATTYHFDWAPPRPTVNGRPLPRPAPPLGCPLR